MKRLKKLLFSRVFVVGVFIAIQLALILIAVIGFSKYFLYYYLVTYLLGLAYILRIIHDDRNMAYKLAWIVVILLFPPFGVSVYEIFCGNHLSERVLEKMRFMSAVTKSALGNGEVTEALKTENPEAWRQSAYIANTTLCPPYRNCETEYYKNGESMLPLLLAELEKAERYIFLEYFIVEDGKMWGEIHAILKRKAAEGIDVRLIYDDIGCIMTLPRDFCSRMERDGIKCKVFHRFVPILSSRQNNRDHRKICVIDGKTAFTGGINIADEYINHVEVYGYWKDNAVRLRGEGAWSFTVMFLTMWDYLCRTAPDQRGDYSMYKPDFGQKENADGSVVQPYTDNPFDDEAVGENIYLNILSTAKEYVWITTPYLIIDEQMEKTLCTAAKSGIDVRIITPGIPDKKIIKETTESFYQNLISNGVKIYEYTPGFLHAKTFLSDDKYATVGSVNLDYRSLYLHFECGVWMYGAGCISDIKKDFEEMFEVSALAEIKKNSLARRLFRGVLELLAPLL